MGKSGIKWEILYYFYPSKKEYTMVSFIGDYTCKLDSKGRVTLPSAFKRQMKDGMQDGFVLKRDIFESCLILYPMKEWERQNQIIRSKTNTYKKEHANFLRMFFSGTAEVIPDASSRILLPRRLLEYAGIEAEAVMAGQYGRIEIWSVENYKKVSKADEEFAAMAEKILGGSNDQNDE